MQRLKSLKRTYFWLTLGWVAFNMTLIIFLGASVRWHLHRWLRDNVSGLLLLSVVHR